jgi:hypothetical protein
MFKHDSHGPETPHDRLAMIDRRIARMRAVNAKEGDVLALRLIEHAETERRQILAQLSMAERKPA